MCTFPALVDALSFASDGGRSPIPINPAACEMAGLTSMRVPIRLRMLNARVVVRFRDKWMMI